MKNITIKKQQIIRVEGTGDEKHEAFAHGLNQIHGRILKEKNDVIARIEPIRIEVVKAEEETYTERFLFFFVPRVRISYRVLLDVTVEVTSVVMEEVTFVEKEVLAPNHVPLPRWMKKSHKEAIK